MSIFNRIIDGEMQNVRDMNRIIELLNLWKKNVLIAPCCSLGFVSVWVWVLCLLMFFFSPSLCHPSSQILAPILCGKQASKAWQAFECSAKISPCVCALCVKRRKNKPGRRTRRMFVQKQVTTKNQVQSARRKSLILLCFLLMSLLFVVFGQCDVRSAFTSGNRELSLCSTQVSKWLHVLTGHLNNIKSCIFKSSWCWWVSAAVWWVTHNIFCPKRRPGMHEFKIKISLLGLFLLHIHTFKLISTMWLHAAGMLHLLHDEHSLLSPKDPYVPHSASVSLTHRHSKCTRYIKYITMTNLTVAPTLFYIKQDK